MGQMPIDSLAPHFSTPDPGQFSDETGLPAPDWRFLPDISVLLPTIPARIWQAVEKCNDLPYCGNSGAFSLTILAHTSYDLIHVIPKRVVLETTLFPPRSPSPECL